MRIGRGEGGEGVLPGERTNELNEVGVWREVWASQLTCAPLRCSSEQNCQLHRLIISIIIADKILVPKFFLFPWVPLRRASNFCSNVFLILFPCCESLRWKIWQYCFAVRKTGKNMHFNLKRFPAHLFLGHVRFWSTRSPWQQRRRYKQGHPTRI